MAENNTKGAVHLTSLSLDLTEFNENIRQIEESTAQVADVAVQNLSKIKESLNIPSEKGTLSADTQKLTKELNTASQAAQELANSTKNLSQSLQTEGAAPAANKIRALAESLQHTGRTATEVEEILNSFFKKINTEYSKVTVSAKGKGKSQVFQAVVESANEAGQAIQKVYDLTKKEFPLVRSQVVDKVKQQTEAVKEQVVNIEELNRKYSDLSISVETFSAAIADSKIDRPIISTLSEQVKELKKNIESSASALQKEALSTNEADVVFKNLNATLSKLWSVWREVNKEAQSSASVATVDSDKIRNLALQYANLAKGIESSKVSDNTGMKALANEAKLAEEELKRLALNLETGNISVKQTTDRYDALSSSLIKAKIQFADTGREQKIFIENADRADSLSKKYDSLQTKVARLVTAMTKANLDTPEMQTAINRAKQLEIAVSNQGEAIRSSGAATKNAEVVYQSFSDTLDGLSRKFEHAKTSNAEYKKSLAPIQQEAQATIASLKTLEKSTVFSTSKKKVAELRAGYEEFLNKLKSTNIGVDEAENELAQLQQKFEQLDGTVKRGNTTLENWVNKISESAKWQIANTALNVLRQSFGQLTGTIIETENAVIELRRVLNDKSLVDSEMSSTLYDIAYEFGQTFEAVQEVAIRFAQTGMEWQEVVKATRSTMLGLNTAELEVASATEGLIAVMAQFGMEASDLESVIDKINKTADNFPITSEKIVAALQRAGGTASAFGLTLEETIGIITALGKATGRAGEAIGTAMNSLISFSMKGSSLEKFGEFLGKDVSDYGVLQLWTELGEAIKNAGDEGEAFASKMATSAEFNDLLNEELATSIGLTEEYTKATEETNQMLKDGKDIYSVVGTYRQNYFIALLNNIATAQEAILGMRDAVGYSMQENETAMEAFSKKWNQLVISAKQLAIQFGEVGFLDLMKGAVEATSSVLQLTKSLGGLKTALLAISTVIIAIKREKISEYFNSIKTVIGSVQNAISIYNAYMATGATATQAMSAALGTLQLSFGGVVGIIGIAVTAFSALAGAQERAAQAAKEQNDETIRNGIAAANSIKALTSAYRDYTKAQEEGDLDSLNKSRETLVTTLGYEKEALDALNSKYDDINQKYEETDKWLKELTESQYALLQSQAESALIAAEKAFGDIKSDADAIIDTYNQLSGLDLWEPLLNDLGITSTELQSAIGGVVNGYEDATRQVDLLNQVLLATRLWTPQQRADADASITALRNRIKELEEVIAQYENAKETAEKYSGTIEETIAAEEAATDSSDNLKNGLDGVATSADGAAEATRTLEDAISDLNKQVDSFQSSYKTLTNVIKEYNETGYLSADNLQTLLGLEPEYLALLENHNGQLSINEEKLQDLIVTQDQYMNDLTALTIAKNIDNMITEAAAAATAGLTIEEYKAQVATQNLQSTTYTLVKQLLDGEISADSFKSAIANVGTQAGVTGGILSEVTGNIVDMTNAMSGFYSVTNQFGGRNIDEIARSYGFENSAEPGFKEWWAKKNQKTGTVNTGAGTLGRYYTPSTSKSGGGGGGSSSDPYKAEKDALNELLDIYEHSIFLLEKNGGKAEDVAAIYRKMQEEVHAQAERYRAAGLKDTDENIRQLQEKWWKYQDAIEEVLHGIYEESVKGYENAIKTLEHLYDSAEQRTDYSYMGENLKKQLDYQIKIQREAERELERLAEKGIEANDDAAQDVIDTWYDAEKAIRDISQKIQESILQPYEDFIDLADKFDIWEYMDFTKVDYLRMELQEINEMLADGTMSLKEYNAQLKQISYAIFDAQKELFEKQKDDIEAAKNEVIKAYKADVDSLKAQKDQVNDYYASVIDGYNAEIDTWEKRKDEVTDYYDKLIDNLKDVQEANERINAQVDYYNNRQKIITNLEQAQARSGVEWREKEMEYQQSLIDLDEEWRRKQEDWNIEDQIESLEKLKEMALKDIDLSIQAIRDTITAAEEAKKAAIESIEAEIAGIEEVIDATEKQAEEEIALIDAQIKELSQTIAEAIKNGTADGIVNSQAELDQALVDGTNAMLGFIDSTSQKFVDSSQETANSVYGAYDNSFITPMYSSIDGIIEHMQSAIPTGASSAAQQALAEFNKSLVAPLKQEMANLMSTSNSLQNSLNSLATSYNNIGGSLKNPINAGKGPVATTAKVDTSSGIAWKKPGLLPFAETATNVFITNNNIGSTASSVARKNTNQLLQLVSK